MKVGDLVRVKRFFSQDVSYLPVVFMVVRYQGEDEHLGKYWQVSDGDEKIFVRERDMELLN